MDDDVKVNEELCPFCGAKEFDGYPVDRYLTHFICHSCCKEWVD
jgi:transposase-like protein